MSKTPSSLGNVIRIWKARNQIIEGLTHAVFKREDVEEIAEERMRICISCNLYDSSGVGCMIPGTQPCCDIKQGGCGCSLKLKTRSLSSSCPHPEGPKWSEETTEEEEDKINRALGI